MAELPPAEVIDETDTLVVGGGILGCSAAHALAGRGVPVMVINRGDFNAQASGANAGSLHVQINSHFAKIADPAVARAIDSTRPLHVAAVAAWRKLAAELDGDVELAVGGGLMVAESEKQIDFLASVVAREARSGGEATLVSGPQLRTLAPYLAPSVIAASYCPLEGKVNPAVATSAIARAAMRAGAAIAPHTALLGLTRTADGFAAQTSRGVVRCRNVVNAAGPWAGAVAAMVGLHLPVEGRPLHMNVTEPTTPFLPHLVQHTNVRLTMKQAARGNVIVGGGWPGELDAASGHLRVRRTSIEGNLFVAQQVVPRLSSLHLIRTWSALIYSVPDVSPVLGPTRVCPGFLVAIAIPNGYTLGPLCGEIVAEFILGRRHPLYHDGYSPDRYGGGAPIRSAC